MARKDLHAQSFELGPIRVDPTRGMVLRDGQEFRLEPQLMDLLLMFVETGGRLVTKDELVARIWDGRAIGDDTLAAAISRLRTALGETKSRRYIETLPKRGYRFLAASEVDDNPGRVVRERSPASTLVASGNASLKLMLPPAIAQARVYFEGAIRQDPKRADAHAGLAEAMLTQLMMAQGPSQALIAAARSAAQAATALDENLAAGWAVLGFATLLADRDFALADAAFARAIGLDPALASAHRGRCFAFSCVGRFAEAEREARRQVECEPLSLSARNDLLQTLIAARRYSQAVVEARIAFGISTQAFQAWSAKGWSHSFLGEEKEAIQAFMESLKTMGTDEIARKTIAGAFETGGLAAGLSAGADLFQSQRLLFMPRPMDVAMMRAMAGESDLAFSALAQAEERDDPILLLAPYLPQFDRLRNDPRFALLLERIRPVK